MILNKLILLFFSLEEGIDGEALKELVGDFQEFSALIPAPLARLRIKKILKTMETVYSEDGETNSDEVYLASLLLLAL